MLLQQRDGGESIDDPEKVLCNPPACRFQLFTIYSASAYRVVT